MKTINRNNTSAHNNNNALCNKSARESSTTGASTRSGSSGTCAITPRDPLCFTRLRPPLASPPHSLTRRRTVTTRFSLAPGTWFLWNRFLVKRMHFVFVSYLLSCVTSDRWHSSVRYAKNRSIYLLTSRTGLGTFSWLVRRCLRPGLTVVWPKRLGTASVEFTWSLALVRYRFYGWSPSCGIREFRTWCMRMPCIRIPVGSRIATTTVLSVTRRKRHECSRDRC